MEKASDQAVEKTSVYATGKNRKVAVVLVFFNNTLRIHGAGIFTNQLGLFGVNVGKYSIHGSSGT